MDSVVTRRIEIFLFILANPGTTRRAIQRQFMLSESQARRCTNALESAGLIVSQPLSEAPSSPLRLFPAAEATPVIAAVALALLQELSHLEDSLFPALELQKKRLSDLEAHLRDILGG